LDFSFLNGNLAVTVDLRFFKRLVPHPQEMAATLQQIILIDPIVDRATLSAAGQDAFVFHQPKMLRCILQGGVDSGSYVTYGHLPLAQGPQNQYPRGITKDSAYLGLSLCDLSDSGFHGLVPAIR
jgi:hypothetical protein